MTGARHEQAVSILTGLERFVRLVVERELLLPRDGLPPNFSSSSPSPSPGPEKSPRVFSLSKPYTGLYSANSYIANRPGYTNYRRSIGDQIQNENKQSSANSSPEPSRVHLDTIKTEPESVKANGPEVHNTLPPQPAPRKISTQNNSETQHKPLTLNNIATSEADDVQVLPKPITNEEFQAMIPQHFLHSKTQPTTSSDATGPTVTVTINRPDPISDINFPPAPTTVGKVTEVITKSTFTETVVTRVTDNKLVLPLIIEVSKCKFVIALAKRENFQLWNLNFYLAGVAANFHSFIFSFYSQVSFYNFTNNSFTFACITLILIFICTLYIDICNLFESKRFFERLCVNILMSVMKTGKTNANKK